MKEFDRFSFPRNYSGKVPLFFRKFPEKFRRKFPEISQLTTLPVPQQLGEKAHLRTVAAILANATGDAGLQPAPAAGRRAPDRIHGA